MLSYWPPRLPREMKKYEDPNFEFRVRDMAAADQSEKSWTEGQGGVLVEAVREGGWAALGHLADGDLLLEIDGTAVVDSGSADNAFDSTATGWVYPNSLGVDAKGFAEVELPSGVGTLTPSTAGDQYLIGVVTVRTTQASQSATPTS